MTDINNSGTIREVLYTISPALDVAGVVREVLVSSPTALVVAAVVREVLLLSPVVVSGLNTAVSVNSG